MKFFKKNYLPFLFTALVAAACMAVSCSDGKVDPLEENPGLFSVYGALSLHQNPNYIRVKDLTQAFVIDSGRVLDATITFEDLQEGTTSTLQDSIINFSGQLTHNFILNKNLQPDRSYRLTVTEPGGEFVTSIATTPKITGEEFFGPENADCKEDILFTFKNVELPERIRLEVGFFYDGKFISSLISKVPDRIHKLEYNRERNEVRFRTRPWDLLMEVFPHSHLNDPRLRFKYENLFPLVLCNELDSNQVIIQYIHFGEEWVNYEGAQLGDPTESLDVEGGLGFLGGFRRDSLSFTVDTL